MKPITPSLAVDIIIESPFADQNKEKNVYLEEHDDASIEKGIVLIERKNPPYGWALPGGFVDVGESIEQAAAREAREETSLRVQLVRLLYVYSHPSRDQRGHNVSAVFAAKLASGKQQVLRADDDAKNADVFALNNLPKNIAFDHRKILQDYIRFKTEGIFPDPQEINFFYKNQENEQTKSKN